MIHVDEIGRRWLLQAMRELAQGRPTRFEDILWLGFGDDWTRVREWLVQEGDIRYPPRQELPEITPIGEALIERLARRERRAEQATAA